MSTIAIVIFVAIGLVIMMRLDDREQGKEYSSSARGSSLASYIVAMGVRHCSCSSGVPRLFLKESRSKGRIIACHSVMRHALAISNSVERGLSWAPA